MGNLPRVMNYGQILMDEVAKRPELDAHKIQLAFVLANEVHSGQKRKTGEPYISHPVSVATMLCTIGAEESMICAALLHDAIEDADDREAVENRILETFGTDILFMVESLSKDSTILDKMQQYQVYFEQMKASLHNDAALFFVKLADLIDNLKTLSALSEKSQLNWMHELEDHYIPLFSKHFHSLAMPYREMYHSMMHELDQVIEKYYNSKHSLPTNV